MRRADLKENTGRHGERRRLRYLAPLFALLAGACGYGEIQQLDEQVGEARSDIEVQLQRRTELIPTLLETIERYVRVDSMTLVAVSDSRVELVGAVRARDLAEMEAASRKLSEAVARLLAETAENPVLQSDLERARFGRLAHIGPSGISSKIFPVPFPLARPVPSRGAPARRPAALPARHFASSVGSVPVRHTACSTMSAPGRGRP